MSEIDRNATRVGVRELRQNLSIYLDRVKRGETLEVTERGRPVARLAPTTPSRLEALIADGLATPARRSLKDLPPPIRVEGVSISEVLQRMRDEERW
jgi:prevent-host-death family protein